MLRRIETSSELFVALNRARRRLRIDTVETDSENDLTFLITAATRTLEDRINRALLPTTFDLLIEADHCGGRYTWHWPLVHRRFDIPMAPVRDVAGVFYTDTDDAEQEISAGNYAWQATPEGAHIAFASAYSFPSVSGTAQWPVRVRFQAGYDIPGTTGAGDDPELARDPRAEMAVLFLVGHWLENREAGAAVNIAAVPLAFEMLADQLRVYR